MDLDQLERKLGIDGMSADEQMEVVSALQKSAQEKLDYVRKETIGKSAEVVIQGFKKIKSDLETRFQELDASIQAKASTLKNGVDGKDGKDGKDGRIGKDGAKGEKGDKGDKGDNGLDGQDGVSVTDAKIDFDGSLVITLSTGKEISVGEVVSPEIAEKIKVISTMSTNGAVAVKDEGTSITSGVKTLNFVGAAVTATNSGDDVTINVSAGTGTVTSVAATAGTGISITGSPITTSGTLTITNSAPDQTVVLTASTGISTSGTYPNFTITNSAPDQTVSLTGAGTTSITGTYPNFTVTSNDQFTGTVTSVTGTSPVASSGGATPAISLSAGYGDTLNPYASKTANFVLASPNGSAGVPTFRAVVASDIPTLNQNTTGTAASTPKLLTTNFTIEESGGKLIFKYGATTIASMSSTGVITSASNIVSNGTP